MYKPLGELLYNYNMIYSKDQTVKGDCKIMARGVTALLQKETDRQNSYEILQMVASAGQQLAALPNGAKIVQWALKNVFQNMGVPKELLKDEGVQGQNQAGQGIPGGIPGQQGQAEAAAGQGGQPDMGGQVPGGEWAGWGVRGNVSRVSHRTRSYDMYPKTAFWVRSSDMYPKTAFRVHVAIAELTLHASIKYLTSIAKSACIVHDVC